MRSLSAAPLPLCAGLRLLGSRLQLQGGSLAQSFVSAKHSWTFRQGVVLEIWDHRGHHGVGEASPLWGHSAESLADCVAALSDIHTRWQGGLDDEGWPLCPWLSSLPAARFAWESALCDLLARSRGVSVSTLLGNQQPSIARSAVVQSLDEARQALERGVRTLKIKVGSPKKEADEELHMLHALRTQLGDDFALRLDANGVWTASEARARLASFRALRPEFVEQPTSTSALLTLGECAVPWAADESLSDDSALDALLAAPGCTAWVIKPAMLGLRRSRELAIRAQRHGLGVVVTHLLDGPIGLAAACELALSLPIPPLACGLDTHPGLSAWPLLTLPHHQESPASIVATGHSGLGFPTQGLPWI